MNLLNVKKEFIPQRPIPLVDQIADFLTDAIIEGILKEGERLVENELQRRFGISRAPIRESFRILEKNGLVVINPRKGTFIRKITQKDIKENFLVRAELEGLAGRFAVVHMEKKDIEEMEFTLLKMTEASRGNDFRNLFKHHIEYHKIFINASRNDTLIGILENLRRQIIWFMFSYEKYIQKSFKYSINVHRDILDLFIKRDADGVATLVKDHILMALDGFLQFFVSKNKGLE
jgi:DNA-binding GntR family transcriptional regulator